MGSRLSVGKSPNAAADLLHRPLQWSLQDLPQETAEQLSLGGGEPVRVLMYEQLLQFWQHHRGGLRSLWQCTKKLEKLSCEKEHQLPYSLLLGRCAALKWKENCIVSKASPRSRFITNSSWLCHKARQLTIAWLSHWNSMVLVAHWGPQSAAASTIGSNSFAVMFTSAYNSGQQPCNQAWEGQAPNPLTRMHWAKQ